MQFTFVVVVEIILALALGCSKSSVQNNGSAMKGDVKSVSEQSGRPDDLKPCFDCIPEMMVREASIAGAYVKEMCDRIAKLDDAKTRTSLYLELVQKAVQTRFEKIGNPCAGDCLSKNEIHVHDTEICLSNAHAMLVNIVDEVWMRLYLDDAPGEILFSPWFDVIEKLKAEEQRLGRGDTDLFKARVGQVERLFNLFYLQDRRHAPNPEERIRIEARFLQVVGRPLRDWSK